MDAKLSFDFGLNVPIQFSIVNSAPVEKHWHPQLEIAYVLSGEAQIAVYDQKYSIKEDQLLVINPYTIHSVINENCHMAIFLINLTIFDQTLVNESLQIDCNSLTITNDDKLNHLKNLLAKVVHSNMAIDNPKHIELLNKSLAYAIIYELINNFSVNEDNSHTKQRSHINRMEDIIKYINLHYAKNITLNQLSEQFFLTVPYLSRIFKKYIKMTFTDYLNNLRLAHAFNYLENPAMTIEKVAQLCGFPNTRSFVTAFKREYNSNPSEYRNKNLATQKNSTTILTTYSQHNQFPILSKYLNYSNTDNVKYHFPDLLEIQPIDVTQRGLQLKHKFKTMIGIGKAKHLLYAETQKILMQIQQEIEFSYITFYGILDDDLMVYAEDGSGIVKLNFQYIDTIIDFLMSIRLKPFMQLSFMPKALAKTPDRTMFFHPSIISLPNSLEKWCFLISELIKHLEIRYTVKEVESWPFCVWNEPESPTDLFGFENKESFFEFYQATYEVVKKCNSNISFGTPSFICETLEEMDWFIDFMTFCHNHHCCPEFLNYHFFPLLLKDKKVEKDFISSSTLIYRESPDALQESINTIIQNLKLKDFRFQSIYITEWNSSISHFDLINDTAFKATYITKNILENYDRFDSLSYWMLTDFNDELHMSEDMYSGGLGLFTSNGVPKASYYAFYLLNQLGNTLIGKGNGYFITKNENSYQIILYNYQHFSKTYAKGELTDLTKVSRYTPFENTIYKKYVIPLQGLHIRKYTITETILNQNHGSSFDKWLEFGAHPLENLKEIEYLKSISLPLIKKRIVPIEHGCYTLSCELEPHEVRLIQIT